MRWQSRWLSAFIGSVVVVLTACGGSTAQPTAASTGGGGKASASPYLVGVTFPLTGPESHFGDLILAGAKIVIGKINAAGGVNGHPLKLDIKDSQGTAAGGVSAMRDVIENDHVPVVLTIFTNVVSAQLPQANHFKIPFLTVIEAAGMPKLSKYLYTVAPNHTQNDAMLAKYWRSKGIKRVFMFAPDDPVGTYDETSLAKVWGPKGKNWTDARFKLGAGDFSGLVAKARAYHPDAILVTGHGTADEPQIMKQLRQFGVTAPIFENSATPTIYSYRAAMLPEAAGTIFTGPKCDLQKAAPYIDAYKQVVGHYPDYASRDFMDVVRMMAAGLKHGYSASAVESYLLHLKSFSSICGTNLVPQPGDHGYIVPPVGMWQLKANGSIVPFQG